MNLRVSPFLAFLLGLAACTAPTPGLKTGPMVITDGKAPTDTSQVATGDLYPSMSATADADGIHVWAAFPYDAGFLPLGHGDRLTVTVGGVSTLLAEDPGDDDPHYTVVLPPNADATSVVVSLERTNGQPNAPDSVVPIAAPFSLAPGDTLRVPQSIRDRPLFDLHMTPYPAPGTKVTYQVSGPCIPLTLTGERAASVDDSPYRGGDGIALDFPSYLSPTVSACPIAIDVFVRTRGSWDSALRTDPAADVFEGAQRRTVGVIVDPTGSAP